MSGKGMRNAKPKPPQRVLAVQESDKRAGLGRKGRIGDQSAARSVVEGPSKARAGIVGAWLRRFRSR